MKPSIRKYMTKNPHTIGQAQTLEAAHELMREHRVRHLPVLDAGKLVGILSLRDLHFIETLRDVDPSATTVEEAMTTEVYVASPKTPLDEAASAMAEHKYGCAVIVDEGKVVGVFTTVDALGALASLLREPQTAASHHS
jgi:acetoin utilization protein AcuB